MRAGVCVHAHVTLLIKVSSWHHVLCTNEFYFLTHKQSCKQHLHIIIRNHQPHSKCSHTHNQKPTNKAFSVGNACRAFLTHSHTTATHMHRNMETSLHPIPYNLNIKTSPIKA